VVQKALSNIVGREEPQRGAKKNMIREEYKKEGALKNDPPASGRRILD
jgi:hypothetical protein